MKKAPITSLVLAGGLVLSANSMAFAATGSDIVKTGQQFIGKPYLYGASIGDVNEFDCSSFTATVFKNNGITLPRTSSAQSKVGTAIAKANLQVGDLVFFDADLNGSIDHVGIYMGTGQMISAILTGVEVSNVNSTYWAPRYVTARRVLNLNANIPSINPSKNTVYSVKSGDTLSLIGLHYGISVSDLKQLNNLKSDTIFLGQTLKVSGAPQVTTPAGSTTVPSDSSSATAVTPTPAPVTAPTTQPVTYTPAPQTTYKVKSGDSLWKIARHFNLSVASLESINKLKTDRIYVGQTLSLKKPAAKAAPKPKELVSKAPAKAAPIVNLSETNSTTSPSPTTYTVKKGDTLSKIAYKNKLSLTDLIAYNRLSSSLIFPGQKLKLSKTSAPPAESKIKIASVESLVKVVSDDSKVTTSSIRTAGTYTVKKGDTLWDIAVLNDTNTKKIMKANNLTSPFIFPGQKLFLA